MDTDTRDACKEDLLRTSHLQAGKSFNKPSEKHEALQNADVPPNSRRFSYKIYDLEKVKETFNEQEAVNFKTSAAFRNSEEVVFEQFYNTMEAVEAAKRRAFTRFTSSTSQSEIVISAGEERATREMELIWWLNMFKQCQDFGKLTVRFFVSKTTFKR